MLPRHFISGTDDRWRAVEDRMRQLGFRPDGLIEVLHAAQQAFGYLSTEVLGAVATALGVPLSSVYGVATFYSHFTLRPHGRHVCVVCTGTACHIGGSATILAAVLACIAATSEEAVPDERISVLTTRCPGTCSLAPMMVVDGTAVGPITRHDAVSRLEAL
jgi:bidirectional [NiFe] hydrogenase diaphorase subunit